MKKRIKHLPTEAIKKPFKRRSNFSCHTVSDLSLFRQKVYHEVKKIPRGSVSTYAHIAYAIGTPRAVRAVGNALNGNIYSDVPCHRVVRTDGTVGGYRWGFAKKMSILRAEGIEIRKGCVEKRYYFSFPE